MGGATSNCRFWPMCSSGIVFAVVLQVSLCCTVFVGVFGADRGLLHLDSVHKQPSQALVQSGLVLKGILSRCEAGLHHVCVHKGSATIKLSWVRDMEEDSTFPV